MYEIVMYVLCSLGFSLSLYATYVHFELDKKRPLLCDINDHVSCTKAFSSKAGKIFSVPNGVYGMLFYSGMLFFTFLKFPLVLFLGSILGILVSCFLAYQLIFKVRVACIVCYSVYAVNVLLFVVVAKQVWEIFMQ